uniref:Uncharacterized protein n=1 Tax=Arundo donax TaxID=35708 RepID=A0A0A9BXS8_ARUDO
MRTVRSNSSIIVLPYSHLKCGDREGGKASIRE